MKIDINVSDIDLSTVISDAFGGYDEEGEPQPITLASEVARKLVAEFIRTDDYPPLKERIRLIRDEEIRKLVLPSITEAFENPIRKTNGYGEPIGEPVTLREVVVEEARKILQGVKNPNSYGRDGIALGRQLIHDMVEVELRAELGAAIKAEREKVVAAVRTQAADLIAEAVAKGVGGR